MPDHCRRVPAHGNDQPPPVIVAWGAGVDSTAMIIEMATRQDRVDMVLIADMPERPQTRSFIPIFRDWMDAHDIPNEVVRYEPKRFKHWPPYADLLENCLTNGTLPSIAFGQGRCSLKWKVAPQDAWTKAWPLAQQAWERGQKVVRLIGFDCGPRDSQRFAHAEGLDSALFEYRYPLREWGWDREACKERIRREGLPVPVASSCFFCTGMKPGEVRELPRSYLRLIVLMEARAAPRLRTVEGLWRKGTKGLRGREARPGSMTEFIRAEGLLSSGEIDDIAAHAPADLISFQEAAALVTVAERESLRTWLDRFNAVADRLAA